ncbi:hypothetical protein [Bacillus cereus]|uniref:hypothetical protein n=1 Tax=Bacillus cereus TaxID=1396 RepID=UPI0018D0C01C|nr:hypothetical protein [Bacillus cereus]MBH0323356.1 hypothetical protein [Bacillus cereus]
MRDSNYHYLTSSLTSFGQHFDNRISKRISTPIVKRSYARMSRNVYRIVGRARR